MGTATIYRSTDGSAPVLTGQVGSLNALLYACLVTGYGSKSALGWTRAYNDGANNTAAFRQGAGPMHYLRVNDNGPGGGTSKEARALGYEAMSDVNTGTGPFPTAAQMASGVFLRKSATADATARAWVLVGTSKVFYLFMYNGDVASTASGFGFGSAYSIVPADGYATFIMGRDTENGATASYDKFSYFTTTVSGSNPANYMARAYTGVGSSVNMPKWGSPFQAPQTYMGGSTGMTYPNPLDGSLMLSPVNYGTDGYYRGTLPGLWNSLHNSTFTNGDTVDGIGGLTSRTFELISLASGQVFFETSLSTWTEN